METINSQAQRKENQTGSPFKRLAGDPRVCVNIETWSGRASLPERAGQETLTIHDDESGVIILGWFYSFTAAYEVYLRVRNVANAVPGASAEDIERFFKPEGYQS